MSNQSATVHVVFSFSAAKSLRDALRKIGRTDEVIAFPDNLSYGLINPPDPAIRAAWMEKELDQNYLTQLTPAIEGFWTRALASGTRRIAWTSQRSASEYAGFLEWLSRTGDADVDVIDLTHAQIIMLGRDGQFLPPQPALPLALIPSGTIVRNALWDLARPIIPRERESYRSLWHNLRAENAPLRVMREGKLVSAPITYFDPLLLSCATMEWRGAMRLLGDALGDLDEDGYGVSDAVLSARIRALVQAGRLEGRGDLFILRNGEVRLPSARIQTPAQRG